MAKTKLNNTKRYNIKNIIKQYIRNEFEKDERFVEFKKQIQHFTDLAQEEYNRVAGITQDVKDFLQLTSMWGSVDAYSQYFSYYELHMDIDGCYGYNCQFDVDKLKEKCPYIKNEYRPTIHSSSLIRSYLESLEEFTKWISDFEDLNGEYNNLYEKMCTIVDNCKYLEDVKEYLPINSVIEFVNEALYSCNTFISVVTDADINLVRDFINKNKK